MSRRYCVVPGCVGVGALYAFPKEKQLRDMWMAQLKINNNYNLTSKSSVCQNHFNLNETGKKKLKKNAIPNIEVVSRSTNAGSTRIRFCSIEGCVETSDTSKLFKYPTKKERREIWIRNCGSPKNSYSAICINHFDAKYVRGAGSITKNAVPSLNVRQRMGTTDDTEKIAESLYPNLRTFDPKATDITLEQFDSLSKIEDTIRETAVLEEEGLGHSCDCEEKIARNTAYYRKTILALEKKINRLSARLMKFKKKKKKNEANYVSIIAKRATNNHAVGFAKMITSSRHLYAEKEKTIAQNLHFVSPKCYKFMRNTLEFPLPSLSSLHNWRPIKRVLPGDDIHVKMHLKEKMKVMSNEDRLAILIFDEVSVRPDLEYDNKIDRVVGFEDDGQKRTATVAKKALVVMAKGIISKWKFVISYYAVNGVDSNKGEHIILENLKLCSEYGLQVKCIICDQGNWATFRSFGCTVERPYFTYNENKVYFMFDYCHLIKSCRNCLLKQDIDTNIGKCSFGLIRRLFQIDSVKKVTRVCPKLTASHVFPTTMEKMNVKKATQVFSNSVAAGLNYYDHQGKFTGMEDLVPSTTKFVHMMNNVFDDLNCKSINDKNKLKKPLFRDDGSKLERLKSYVTFFKSFKVIMNQDRYKFIKGFEITLNCFIQMCPELFDEYKNVQFIALGKFNQDALENLFFQIRNSSGMNSHPSLNEMQFILAKIVCLKLFTCQLRSNNTNCEPDDDANINEWEEAHKEAYAITESRQGNTMEDSFAQATFAEDSFAQSNIEDENTRILEEEHLGANPGADRYFLGYAIFKIFKRKFNCTKCEKYVQSFDTYLQSSEMLIVFKEYDGTTQGLMMPNDEAFEVMQIILKIYKEYITYHLHCEGLKGKICEKIKQKLNEVHPEWYSGECSDHRMQLTEFIVKVLLFKNVKWLKEVLNETKDIRKYLEKMKKLN